jgi:ribosomal protein S18 acetylase RimI-like enzyme
VDRPEEATLDGNGEFGEGAHELRLRVPRAAGSENRVVRLRHRELWVDVSTEEKRATAVNAGSVRPAGPADAVALARLSEAAEGDAVAAVERDLERSTSHVVVAEEAGTVVGFGRVRYVDPERAGDDVPAGWYLMGLVVEPAARRRGHGLALVRSRLDWIAERSSEAWYVANASNAASIALHDRAGFRIVRAIAAFPGIEFSGGRGVLGRADLT